MMMISLEYLIIYDRVQTNDYRQNLQLKKCIKTFIMSLFLPSNIYK